MRTGTCILYTQNHFKSQKPKTKLQIIFTTNRNHDEIYYILFMYVQIYLTTVNIHFMQMLNSAQCG